MFIVLDTSAYNGMLGKQKTGGVKITELLKT